MTIRNAIAIIPVSDLDAALPWYEKLIGRGPDHSETKERIEWLFEQGGRLQLGHVPAASAAISSARESPRESLRLAVGDLDFERRRLEQSGIAVGPVSAGEGGKFVVIHDPEGNAISLAEVAAPAAPLMATAPATAPGTALGESVRGLQSLESALEKITRDTSLRPSEVRKFIDSLILDLKALLRASEENMGGPGADAERAAQLLQRADIVRTKLDSLATPEQPAPS